ncbi:unnamed protein product [Trichobilharzia regenti]|nr:unnamed protein product [Trichobilharzia regenti]
MRDMQLLHKVEETPPNRNGVIALSANESNCYLAYPGSHRVGTVFIFDALSFQVCEESFKYYYLIFDIPFALFQLWKAGLQVRI